MRTIGWRDRLIASATFELYILKDILERKRK